MAPKKAKTVRRDQKHGKNGKKEGLSGSSFFTWFMVIALLGVWTSVAVVWFDLVDYEEFLGKLGDYDADGDGDFDVDDAKVLLGLAQPPVTERATKAPDLKGGLKTKTKEEGLKERSVSAKVSEDLDVTDSLPSDISDDDLEDVIKDSQSLDDGFDLEHALDDHEIQDDVEIDFSLEDAVEPSVHGSLRSEPEVEETEGEPVTEEEVHVEEPTVEELTIDSIIEDILEQELAASHGDNVEEATYEDEHVAYHEQEAEQTDDTEFLNAPTPEIEEPVDVEDGPEPVADEEPEEEQATEDEDPLDENVEEPEKAEYHEESVLMGREDVNEPAEDESDEVNEYNDQTEQEEEEPAELSDEPYGESVPEQTEGAAPEASDTEDAVRDDSEEEINDIPVGEEPSESAEDHNEEPESPHEHVEVEQHEMPEHPVVDGRPADRVEEQVRHSSEGQHGEHADT